MAEYSGERTPKDEQDQHIGTLTFLAEVVLAETRYSRQIELCDAAIRNGWRQGALLAMIVYELPYESLW
jgi:hypothetical protein